MLVPISDNILPQTSRQRTTLTSNLAKKLTATRSAAARPLTTTATATTTTTTTATIIKQGYHLLALLTLFHTVILSGIAILLNTVCQRLSSLMNDIWTKLRYLTNATAATTAATTTLFNSLSSSTSSLSSIDNKHFNNNYKSNHRTYNNSSKSNKVFLHYTPRDPRLRIFNSSSPHALIAFNKHLALESDSELKITDDLCNYGELIGGGDNSERNNKRCTHYFSGNNNTTISNNNPNNRNSAVISDCYFDSANNVKSVKSVNQSISFRHSKVSQLKSFVQGHQSYWLITGLFNFNVYL